MLVTGDCSDHAPANAEGWFSANCPPDGVWHSICVCMQYTCHGGNSMWVKVGSWVAECNLLEGLVQLCGDAVARAITVCHYCGLIAVCVVKNSETVVRMSHAASQQDV